ncbi:hypothetical protein CcrC1_gp479 [Caulobacter phage C1]|nr:hypothetical protein CcrC1_gp479 [Caulobacter phage C1]UTU08688.1 hypothetical protein CcrC2_gp461 [Caulobacter phage C2]WGN97354.1 hypothetical protein [Bertelyvirus sp.]WGN97892.1 hypothetical protein [Bertelyvirus sp.]
MTLALTLLGWLLKAILALLITAVAGTILVVVLYFGLILLGVMTGVVLIAAEMRKEAARVDHKVSVSTAGDLRLEEAVIPLSRTRSVKIERATA